MSSIDILTIAITILSVIVLPALGFVFQLNTRVVKLEDNIKVNSKLNDILFKKLDSINDKLNAMSKELHYLIKIDGKG